MGGCLVSERLWALIPVEVVVLAAWPPAGLVLRLGMRVLWVVVVLMIEEADRKVGLV